MYLRRTAHCIVVVLAWSCAGSITEVDRVPGNVVSIDVTPSSATVTVGVDAPFQATVRDESGLALTGVPLMWSVRDTAIARISPTGVVTARSVGNTQIAASAGGVSAIATLTVQPPPVASVAVAPSSASLVVGESVTLVPTVKDASGAVLTDRTVSWSSSNPAAATVSAIGLVTAVSPGSATVTAASEGVSTDVVVTVSLVPVGSVAILPTSANLTVGQTATLAATVRDTAGVVVTDRIVTWMSSDLRVALVSTAGVVTGVAPGFATITAASEGKTGASAITVVPAAVASVTLQPDSATIRVGASTTFTPTVKDVTGAIVSDRDITWTSSNIAVATVSDAGVVTGRAAGTVTVSATSGGKSGSAFVTVLPEPVATVTLEPASVRVEPGQTATLTATTKSADGTVLAGRAVTFASDNVNVARVSSDGVVTGVSPGTATITATSEGRSATAAVTVQPTVAYVVVAPTTVFLRRNSTVQLSVTAYDAAGHEIVGRTVTWATDNDHVATVSGSGLVTGEHAGTAMISATIDGRTGTTRVTVTN